MEKLADEPLVSIIVITFNSSNFVHKTLESIKSQTYRYIELIISDDGSTDNTCDLCNNWILENKDRFVRSELITTETNTGISPNCNRGLHNSNGEWLKFIAGDDILVNDCIENFIFYIKDNPSCKILFGKIINLENEVLVNQRIPEFFNKKNQEKLVYSGSGIQAPALFINNVFIKSIGGFDERYKFIEDVPLWIKVTKYKEKFHFIDKYVVIYRFHGENICMPGKSSYINTLFYFDHEKLIFNDILPFLFSKFYIFSCINLLNYIVVNRLIILFGNKNSYISRVLDLFNLNKTIRRLLNYMSKLKVG